MEPIRSTMSISVGLRLQRVRLKLKEFILKSRSNCKCGIKALTMKIPTHQRSQHQIQKPKRLRLKALQ
jgi:hypothetical protein